jgi:hypothetical protein
VVTILETILFNDDLEHTVGHVSGKNIFTTCISISLLCYCHFSLTFVEYATNLSMNELWIGLNDVETEDSIKWISGSSTYPSGM